MSTPGTSFAAKEGRNSQCQPRRKVSRPPDTEIENIVGGRLCPFNDERKHGELQNVCEDCQDHGDTQTRARRNRDGAFLRLSLLRHSIHIQSILQSKGKGKPPRVILIEEPGTGKQPFSGDWNLFLQCRFNVLDDLPGYRDFRSICKEGGQPCARCSGTSCQSCSQPE